MPIQWAFSRKLNLECNNNFKYERFGSIKSSKLRKNSARNIGVDLKKKIVKLHDLKFELNANVSNGAGPCLISGQSY